MSFKTMVSFIDTLFRSMIYAFQGGSTWSRAARVRQNVRHVFGIPALTKSRLGKKQIYEVMTPDQRDVLFHAKSANTEF